FPGQGAQKVGLLADVRARFSAFRSRFEALEAAAARVLGAPLSEWLYAEPGEEAERALAATEVCQPAMAALSLSLAALLEAANVKATVSLGHSLGEFTALAHGGVLSGEAAVELVAARGVAM